MTDNERMDTPDVVEVGDKKFEVIATDDKLQIIRPEGMDNEAWDKWKADASNGEKLSKAYLEKLNKVNTDRSDLQKGWAELEAEKQRLAEDKAKLGSQPTVTTQAGNDSPNLKSFADYAGLSKMDLDNLKVDEPDRYDELKEKYVDYKVDFATDYKLNRIKQESKQEMDNAILQQKIILEGNSPAEVIAFCRHYQMPLSQSGYDLYQKTNAPKTDRLTEARLKANELQLDYVDNRGTKPKGVLSKADMANLTVEELDAILNS
jgi:hypothetical protein